ncbi:MAG TPA: cell division protein FtsZ [Solirubrobacterales bacterium]|nr:cell division protein FtsZ [Solirubrobacterales bacterium]
MREGPLADLFRSTEAPDDPPEPPARPERREEREERGAAAPEPPAEEQETSAQPESTPESEPVAEEPPAPEPKPEYKPRDEPVPSPGSTSAASEPGAVPRREPKDRLRDVFGRGDEREPAYGRTEPAAAGSAAPEIHDPLIRVVGVGGGGVNAVNRMVEAGISGVEFMAVNTDLQSLQSSAADVTIHIGGGVTRGLGSGSDPELGYRAAFEEQDRIKRMLKGSDMVFVAAGAGGGTGTGAAPVLARLARDVGALTVGIVTRPFGFEGTRRAKQAEKGIDALADEVDTLIVVPNDRLLSVLERNTSMVEAFRVADDVLRQGVQGISDLITLPALINLDFADVRTTMRDAGPALLGIGMGTGDTRASVAAEKAISSPLLETSIEGARSILLSITGGGDLSLVEISEAARVIQEAAHPEAHIIFGANVDEDLHEQIWVTVIATRFDARGRRADGSSTGVHRSTARPSARRGKSDRTGAKRVPRHDEQQPGDLGIDVPEFIPN